MDLIQATLEVPQGVEILVIAHPGSGTRWVVQKLTEAHGREWFHEGDLIMDGQRGLVTYLRWDLENWDAVFWLVRHPLHTVFSIARYFDERERAHGDHRVLREVVGRLLGEDPTTWGTLRASARSVAHVVGRCLDELKLEPYQLEEIPGRADQRFARGGAKAASWERLMLLDEDAANRLFDQTCRLGYDPEV